MTLQLRVMDATKNEMVSENNISNNEEEVIETANEPKISRNDTTGALEYSWHFLEQDNAK